MKKDYIKFAVAILVLVLLSLVIGFFMTNDLEIFGHKIRAIKGYSETLSELVGSENGFEVTSNSQKAKIKELEQAKKDFEIEKDKYEKIPDSTIEMIKNASKKEKYSLEYLWVRIGQYAKKYNLNISLIEPGGTIVAEEEAKPEEPKEEVKPEDELPKPPEKPLEAPSVKPGEEKPGEEKPEKDKKSKNYRIQAIGNYDKIADFVYAIETDETLRFKLDNIVMESTEQGISARFEIKNLDIIE